jgi:hypothetical protein
MGVEFPNYSNAALSKGEQQNITNSKTNLENLAGTLDDLKEKDAGQDKNDGATYNSGVNLSVKADQVDPNKGLDNPKGFDFNIQDKKAERAIVMPDIKKLEPVPDPGTVELTGKNGIPRSYIGPFNNKEDARQFISDAMNKPFNSLSENQQKLFLQITNGMDAMIYENEKDGKFYIPFGQPTGDEVPKHFEQVF